MAARRVADDFLRRCETIARSFNVNTNIAGKSLSVNSTEDHHALCAYIDRNRANPVELGACREMFQRVSEGDPTEWGFAFLAFCVPMTSPLRACSEIPASSPESIDNRILEVCQRIFSILITTITSALYIMEPADAGTLSLWIDCVRLAVSRKTVNDKLYIYCVAQNVPVHIPFMVKWSELVEKDADVSKDFAVCLFVRNMSEVFLPVQGKKPWIPMVHTGMFIVCDQCNGDKTIDCETCHRRGRVMVSASSVRTPIGSLCMTPDKRILVSSDNNTRMHSINALSQLTSTGSLQFKQLPPAIVNNVTFWAAYRMALNKATEKALTRAEARMLKSMTKGGHLQVAIPELHAVLFSSAVIDTDTNTARLVRSEDSWNDIPCSSVHIQKICSIASKNWSSFFTARPGDRVIAMADRKFINVFEASSGPQSMNYIDVPRFTVGFVREGGVLWIVGTRAFQPTTSNLPSFGVGSSVMFCRTQWAVRAFDQSSITLIRIDDESSQLISTVVHYGNTNAITLRRRAPLVGQIVLIDDEPSAIEEISWSDSHSKFVYVIHTADGERENAITVEADINQIPEFQYEDGTTVPPEIYSDSTPLVYSLNHMILNFEGRLYYDPSQSLEIAHSPQCVSKGVHGKIVAERLIQWENGASEYFVRTSELMYQLFPVRACGIPLAQIKNPQRFPLAFITCSNHVCVNAGRHSTSQLKILVFSNGLLPSCSCMNSKIRRNGTCKEFNYRKTINDPDARFPIKIEDSNMNESDIRELNDCIMMLTPHVSGEKVVESIPTKLLCRVFRLSDKPSGVVKRKSSDKFGIGPFNNNTLTMRFSTDTDKEYIVSSKVKKIPEIAEKFQSFLASLKDSRMSE